MKTFTGRSVANVDASVANMKEEETLNHRERIEHINRPHDKLRLTSDRHLDSDEFIAYEPRRLL